MVFAITYGALILICLVWGAVLYRKTEDLDPLSGLYGLVLAALISAGFPLFSLPMLIVATVWFRRV